MKWLITGGLGFIGTNLSKHLSESGHEVIIIDDLTRAGVAQNEKYLNQNFGIRNIPIDISNRNKLEDFFKSNNNFDCVAHLAGQVSFVASVLNPYRDFEINALGTLNVLECVRKFNDAATVIGISSNKIYGDLESLPILETEKRYVLRDWPNGLNESLPLSFEGPYGCSKGVLDQYIIDYSRIYGLKTVSLRQSSVYGEFQHPMSDQGWVAFLVREAVRGNKIKLNGIGKQVRDLLFATDLARLFDLLSRQVIAGEPAFFNIGGGKDNSLSILELFDLLETKGLKNIEFETGEFRKRDQKVFISDNTKIRNFCGWEPTTNVETGITRIIEEELKWLMMP
jgi:CDP-paratose 2-epimerase